MSTFSFPDATRPESMMDMSNWMKEMQAMPVGPLMAHPMAASAAATALGVAAAGQMLGLMMGSMQGALEMSRRMGFPSAEEFFESADAWQAGDVFGMPGGRTAPVPPAAAPEPAAAKGASPRKASAPQAKARAAETVSDLKAAADSVADAAVEARDVPAPARAEVPPQTDLSPEEFRRPPEMAKPEAPDDLKQISGIGPKLEQVLNGIGIWTFGQIVALSPQEVGWLDDYLQFKGRIERDGWQAQAKSLAAAGQ